MEKLKEALRKLFDDKIDEDGITGIMASIEVKITESVTVKMDELRESTIAGLEAENVEKLREYSETLALTIDKYLETATTEFFETNEVAIHSDIKVTMSENIMSSLTATLKENNIVIPESEVDVIADLEGKITTLETRVTGGLDESIELTAQILEHKKALSFTEKTSKLTETAKERVKNVIKEMTCVTIDDFNTKLDILIDESSTSHGYKPDDFIQKEVPKKIKDSKIDESGKVITEGVDTTFADSLLK